MPRKTKESAEKKESLASRLFNRKNNKKEEKKKEKEKEETKKPKTSTKKASKSVDEKKTNSKTSTKKVAKSVDEKKTDSKTSTKKSASSKKDEISPVEKIVKSKTTKKEKNDSSKEEKKSTLYTTSKKVTSKSAKTSLSTKKEEKESTTKKSKSTSLEKEDKQVQSYTPEYYDLPYHYNQTTVKILAQTPTNLFIYWEISDKDRENLKQQYGQYFFEITKPVLIVHNETMNYSFEVDIDDFANSWYLHVNDSNCKYRIELGRRPIPINYTYMPQYDVEKEGPIQPVENPYIYISTSNQLESPNDHILFNKQNKIYFRNIKTNEIIEKDISDFPFINSNNKFIDIYNFYEKLYKNDNISNSNFLHNPSSGNPSSGSFSSKFK